MRLPDCRPQVLYQIGLALESGCTDEQMRSTHGDETVNWLDEAMRDPEFVKAYPPTPS